MELLAPGFWERWKWHVVATILGLTCVLFALSRNKLINDEIRHLKHELARLEQKCQDAESTATLDLASCRSATHLNEEKLKQIDSLVARPTPDLANRISTILGTKPPNEKAKEHWAALKVDQSTTKMLEELERRRKERKIPDDQYKLLKEWIGLLHTRSADWSTWDSRRRVEEVPFVEAWTTFRKSPWDESLQQSADQSLEALRVSSRTWWTYASKTSDSWDVFRNNLEAAAKAQSNPHVEKFSMPG